MSRVLVVCTIHNTQRAVAAELHWLLCRLGPDVVFVEHPVTDVSSFRDGSCRTLESAAVMRYLGSHKAELVPVDVDPKTYEPSPELKSSFDEMFRAIAEASSRYRLLDSIHSHEIERGGFAYLNSPIGYVREAELIRETRSTVEASRDHRLTQLYELWVRIHDRREWAMLVGVEDYARENSFKKGVLLVGGAHRLPLIEKLQQRPSDDHSQVTWEFEWELDDSISAAPA